MRIPIPAIVIPAVVLALYFLVPGVRGQPWTALRMVGVFLAVIGYSLLITARIQLGNSFAVTPQAKALVTHGLYARIRNPIYVFVGVLWFGVTLALHFYWLFLPWCALLVLQTVRARQEGLVMQKAFGQAYIDYRKQTWF
jgi:protein-S-isoprenylcysteine O-methyltransferase Ste14